MTETVLVWSIGAAVGVVVWAVRIEGKVNAHERELDALRDDIRYVRDRIDQALGTKR